MSPAYRAERWHSHPYDSGARLEPGGEPGYIKYEEYGEAEDTDEDNLLCIGDLRRELMYREESDSGYTKSDLQSLLETKFRQGEISEETYNSINDDIENI